MADRAAFIYDIYIYKQKLCKITLARLFCYSYTLPIPRHRAKGCASARANHRHKRLPLASPIPPPGPPQSEIRDAGKSSMAAILPYFTYCVARIVDLLLCLAPIQFRYMIELDHPHRNAGRQGAP